MVYVLPTDIISRTRPMRTSTLSPWMDSCDELEVEIEEGGNVPWLPTHRRYWRLASPGEDVHGRPRSAADWLSRTSTSESTVFPTSTLDASEEIVVSLDDDSHVNDDNDSLSLSSSQDLSRIREQVRDDLLTIRREINTLQSWFEHHFDTIAALGDTWGLVTRDSATQNDPGNEHGFEDDNAVYADVPDLVWDTADSMAPLSRQLDWDSLPDVSPFASDRPTIGRATRHRPFRAYYIQTPESESWTRTPSHTMNADGQYVLESDDGSSSVELNDMEMGYLRRESIHLDADGVITGKADQIAKGRFVFEIQKTRPSWYEAKGDHWVGR